MKAGNLGLLGPRILPLHVCATESSPGVLSGSLRPRRHKDKVWPVTRQDAALLTLAAAWPGQGSRSYSLSPSLPRRHKDKALSVTRQDAALLTLAAAWPELTYQLIRLGSPDTRE